MRPPAMTETICAVSTPIGEGGIGIIRLSGPKAISVVKPLFRGLPPASLDRVPSHTIQYGHLIDPPSGRAIDEVLVTVMRSPRTYTREDVVEINAHGGPFLLDRILSLIIRQGARLAEPGEFTKRAFLNGRIDLTKAEAVMDLIQAKTEASYRAAMIRLEGALGREIHDLRDRLRGLLAIIEAQIDFPEDELEAFPMEKAQESVKEVFARVQKLLDTLEEGRILREGLATVIVGRTNVGKSSLLNRLLRVDRAIVTPIPGTTRDLLEETLNIRGVPVRVTDTAGLRASADPVEQEGIRRTRSAIEGADLILLMAEAPAGLKEEEVEFLKRYESRKKVILVINKIDLAANRGEAIHKAANGRVSAVQISATRGDGLDALRDSIRNAALSSVSDGENGILIARLHHKSALLATRVHLEEVMRAIDKGMPEEIIAMDLRGALDRLGEIIGETTTEDILDRIFREFCIGK